MYDGLGSDISRGGAGDDLLAGGAGADVFVFAGDWGNDVIADFVAGEDTLDFTAAQLAQSDLTISETGGDTVIQYGANSILLDGVTGFDSGDILSA